MKNAVSIIKIIFSLVLGGMLVFGGIKKFENPSPAPTTIVETVKKGEEVAPNIEILKIKNYVFGMRQTDYFWQFLGYVEIIAGVLLISQFFSLLGAIVAFPVTINIFLFHLFLEPNEVGELIQILGLLLINIALIGFSFKLWKPILVDRNILKLN
jgi:uncharacterized membrane protein YphA (DoxX/SURF4 family)